MIISNIDENCSLDGITFKKRKMSEKLEKYFGWEWKRRRAVVGKGFEDILQYERRL